jgi:hypothetical protein
MGSAAALAGGALAMAAAEADALAKETRELWGRGACCEL